MQNNTMTKIEAMDFLKKIIHIEELTNEDEALEMYNKERGYLKAEYRNEKDKLIRKMAEALLILFPKLQGRLKIEDEKLVESSEIKSTPAKDSIEQATKDNTFEFSSLLKSNKVFNKSNIRRIFNFSTFTINQPNILHEEKAKWSTIDKFFLWCGGTNLEILNECPHETKKYVTIGVILLLISVFAACSWSYAGFFAFGNYWVSIPIGLLCSSLIFFIDRFLIISMKNYEPFFIRLLAAIPRLVLAVFISLVITFPLEMKIFETEINEILEVKKRNNIINDFSTVKKENNESIELSEKKDSILKVQLKGITNSLDELAKKRDKERYKDAINYKNKEVEDKKKEIEENKGYLDKLKETRDSSNGSHVGIVNGIEGKGQQMGGLKHRMDILIELSEEPKTGKIILFITLLFVILETMPILLKLMSRTDSYDIILKNKNRYYEIEAPIKEKYNDEILNFGYNEMLKSDKTRIVNETQIQVKSKQATEEKKYENPTFSENGISD